MTTNFIGQENPFLKRPYPQQPKPYPASPLPMQPSVLDFAMNNPLNLGNRVNNPPGSFNLDYALGLLSPRFAKLNLLFNAGRSLLNGDFSGAANYATGGLSGAIENLWNGKPVNQGPDQQTGLLGMFQSPGAGQNNTRLDVFRQASENGLLTSLGRLFE